LTKWSNLASRARWTHQSCTSSTPFNLTKLNFDQTVKPGQPYLRDWARALDAPILSVDYGLAPAHPFPVAARQCFFAYCWARRHARRLGRRAPPRPPLLDRTVK
jgi:hypothetical protein